MFFYCIIILFILISHIIILFLFHRLLGAKKTVSCKIVRFSRFHNSEGFIDKCVSA